MGTDKASAAGEEDFHEKSSGAARLSSEFKFKIKFKFKTGSDGQLAAVGSRDKPARYALVRVLLGRVIFNRLIYLNLRLNKSDVLQVDLLF